MGKWTKMPLAALGLGALAAALPAAAQNAAAALARAAPAAQRESLPRAKVGKPLVMLVCREPRGQRRGVGASAAGMTCSTRWAGI